MDQKLGWSYLVMSIMNYKISIFLPMYLQLLALGCLHIISDHKGLLWMLKTLDFLMILNSENFRIPNVAFVKVFYFSILGKPISFIHMKTEYFNVQNFVASYDY